MWTWVDETVLTYNVDSFKLYARPFHSCACELIVNWHSLLTWLHSKQILWLRYLFIIILRQLLVITCDCTLDIRTAGMPPLFYCHLNVVSVTDDSTRVCLSGTEDYINASHIQYTVGADQLHYIACQGPMPQVRLHYLGPARHIPLLGL